MSSKWDLCHYLPYSQNATGLKAARIITLCSWTLLASCSTSGAEEPDGGEARSDTKAPDTDGPTNPTSDIFSDSKVPRCDNGIRTQYQLRGTIDGSAVTVSGSAFSDFIKGQYRKLSAMAGKVQVDLSLRWEKPLVFDREVPLTGETLIVPAGHPKAGRQICITEGTFGATPADGGSSVQVFFKITGARDGDCDGPVVPIDVAACTFRKDSFLP